MAEPVRDSTLAEGRGQPRGRVCPAKETGLAARTFSASEAMDIGRSIGVDFTQIDPQEFRMGLAVELEHGTRDPETDVTGDNLEMTGRIALAHLREIPDYYTRLQRMEAEAGR